MSARGKTSPVQTEQGARAWLLLSWVAGLFALAVALVMLFGYLRGDAIEPFKTPALQQYKEQLRLNPADEGLKQRIRAVDLSQRETFFRHLHRTRTGAWLLLGGAAVFVFAFGVASSYKHAMPMPMPRPDAPRQATRNAVFARWSIAAGGAGILLLMLVLSLSLSSALPDRAANVDSPFATAPPRAAADAALPEELLRNWPRFRGPGGNGFCAVTNLPASWDPKTGAGILWKVPAPAQGFNSPIIWSDRVFFSGGDARAREILCLDLNTGKELWRQSLTNVPGSPAQAPEIPESTGYAASTMATDGRRVYAVFANGDVSAFTFEGQRVWAKGFGPLKNPYGYATSLATWQDRLLLQLDQGEAEERKSKLYALDGRSGQIVWQTPRPVGSSWSSPIVIEPPGKAQIVALALPWAIGYAADDGSELWRVEGLNGEITPSPIYSAGLVLVPSPSDRLFAIRPDGHGDVTKTHVAWISEEGVPDVTSPVSNGELVFMLATSGMLTCVDAKDGKKQWDHDYEIEFHSSPSIAGNRVYLFGQKGAAIIVEAARQFKELFRTEMGDGFHASPAFAQDKIVLRGVTNVWCLGRK